MELIRYRGVVADSETGGSPVMFSVEDGEFHSPRIHVPKRPSRSRVWTLIKVAFAATVLFVIYWLFGLCFIPVRNTAATGFLGFDDIIPNLLSKTHALDWGTNVPAYILGFSRGAGGGSRSVGLGISDLSGFRPSFMSADCVQIDWSDHDGFNFGSQMVVPRDGLGEVEIDWLRDDQNVLHARAIRRGSGSLFFLVIEGYHVVPIGQGDVLRSWKLIDKGDQSEWILQTSVSTNPGFVSTVRSGQTSHAAWISPTTLLGRIRDQTQPSTYIPLQAVTIHEPIDEMALIFFPDILQFEYSISHAIEGLTDTAVFPVSLFETHKQNWRTLIGLSEYARKSLAHLQGNMGRFEGDLIVVGPDRENVGKKQRMQLTAIGPSRTRFPRGFLWDEGFHLLALGRFNIELSVEILTSWLGTQLASEGHGWIPREHALSLRDKVSIPPEFIPQDPRIANPPTLIFFLTQLISSHEMSSESISRIAGHVFRWFSHLETTQKSFGGKCYRWSMRTEDHCLSSGLDDYPRGPLLDGNGENECHVDLYSWMMVMVRFMHRLCSLPNAQHQSCDGCHGIDWPRRMRSMHAFLVSNFQLPNHTLLADCLRCSEDKIFSPHRGYVNLFPFLLGLLSPMTDGALIRGTLELMESELASDFGLLSLSPRDGNFGKSEDYWRGNIWANINLLAIGSLGEYGKRLATSEPDLSRRMNALSARLRSGWLSHAISAWKFSNGPREYLRPGNGEGGGVYPFAGWTAASIVLLDNPNTDWWTDILGIF